MTPNGFLMGCYYPEELRGTENKTRSVRRTAHERPYRRRHHHHLILDANRCYLLLLRRAPICGLHVLEQAGSNIFH